MNTKQFKTILLNINKITYLQKYYKHNINNLMNEFKNELNLTEPKLNINYLLNKENRKIIEENSKLRKTSVDLNKIYELSDEYNKTKNENIKLKLLNAMLEIPNTTHPLSPINDEFNIIKTLNEKKTFDFKPKSFLNLMTKNNLCRADSNISHYVGNRSYYFMGDLCLLENAIIQYVLNKLEKLNFNFITVPDILNENIIQRCGMKTRGERSQVYHLEPKYYGEGWCLSGTAEMGIANHLLNQTFSLSELPMKLAAMSRCFRAEISDTGDEKGVYRVHCFTKIEMFGVTLPTDSDKYLAEFLNFEEELFSELGLHIRTLDMGIHELGAQAFRKFDVEAWMPGRKKWGELSSCSDCTDFQSRRLNIKSEDNNFVHTINGTACAIPRLLMAIVETNQNKDGTINIPDCLKPFMFGKEVINDKQGAPFLFKVKSGLSKAKKKEMAREALSNKIHVPS